MESAGLFNSDKPSCTNDINDVKDEKVEGDKDDDPNKEDDRSSEGKVDLISQLLFIA